jgi:hypothetical protein
MAMRLNTRNVPGITQHNEIKLAVSNIQKSFSVIALEVLQCYADPFSDAQGFHRVELQFRV